MMVIVFWSLKEIFKNGNCSPFQGPLSLFSLSCHGNLSLTLLTPLDRHQTCNSLEVDEDGLSFPYHTKLVLRGCQQAICHELYPYTEPETKVNYYVQCYKAFFFLSSFSPTTVKFPLFIKTVSAFLLIRLLRGDSYLIIVSKMKLLPLHDLNLNKGL